jgi:4-hydroxymandelate oxidase
MNTRRTFLQYLAASPLYAALPGFRSFVEAASLRDLDSAINRSSDALDVFDFEPVARKNIPPAHWGYLASGVDGEETLKANRDAYSRYQWSESAHAICARSRAHPSCVLHNGNLEERPRA